MNPLSIVAFFLNNWKIFVAIFIISVAYIAGSKNSDRFWENKILKERNSQLEAARVREDEFIADKQQIVALYEEYRKTHPEIKTKEVKIYVPESSDNKCVIDLGGVLLHNQAASGLPVDGGPGPDATTPTKVKFSEFSEVVTNNYNMCLKEFKKLEALQAEVKSYQEKQKK